jgi:chromate transporter
MTTHALLFWAFFKISLFSIGGGYNMIPLMQAEIEVQNWLPAGRFMDMLAISEATPGPIAVNLATFAGYQVAGISGSIVATVGVCLPGAILLMMLGLVAMHLREKPAFRAAMRGLMPALVGLLTATGIRLGLALVPAGVAVASIPPAVIFAIGLGLIVWKRIPPLPLLIGSAAAGMALTLAGV